ncbi:aldo/keto reductase [Burkholderia lata]|uniref:Aldo/keto reductase n=1 Tax=Burkholderia lata (strain ATCC 17760 / DSM 23089 / LMG 22485 / NCIMB 9086 / R18194 / 383) TaxID=482957 RepID=Q39G79_BURL3|nr:aldo/keto reductase [Burkholderia lata]ABB08537.1 Aldo/keto reductase [Burkholderia lata]
MSLDSYVTLGRSGLRVSPFGLGGNLIDTAKVYSNGHSEKIIGDFFATRKGTRNQSVIATKLAANLHLRNPNGGGTGHKAIIDQCEASLRRLQTDYIDLYQMHIWDRHTPIEETMRALDDLVTAGKVRYIGISDTPAWKVAQAQTTALFRGWAALISMQVEYSLLQRTVEGELVPMATDLDIAIMPWSPLKNGWLSGKYTRESAANSKSERAALVGVPGERDYKVIDVLLSVAAEMEVAPAAVALAWVRSRPGVTSTLIGTRRVDHLRANLAALEINLAAEHRAMLDEVSEPSLNFPADLTSKAAPNFILAGATVNGQTSQPLPMLVDSEVRY